MARKKEERGNGSRNKNKKGQNKREKSQKTSGSEDVDIIKSQLFSLGLSLRQVPGDGNCLFRALGDQLDGHMGNHYRHRKDTTNYMLEHQDDFQPFVEDDISFEKHISELAKLGEYAGNDAIVAFARLYQVTVVIHQPNFPLWQIKDWESVAGDNLTKNDEKHFESNRQLHIAYHGGDHYDSVRRLGDTSHIPANISLQIDDAVKKPSKADETFDSYYNSDDDDADYHEESGSTDFLDAAIKDLLSLSEK